MLVITGISDSLQDFSKCMGMGSRQQEVDLLTLNGYSVQ